MIRRTIRNVAAAALILIVAASSARANQPVAFTNVNVIPMDRERVMKNRTVVVASGAIRRIGPADEVDPPDGATIVQADGQKRIDGGLRFEVPRLPFSQVPFRHVQVVKISGIRAGSPGELRR